MTEEFGERGQRLWDNLLERDSHLVDSSNPMREIAVSACHAADRVADLELRCKTAEPVISKKNGDFTNPLFIECRNQGIMMARLVAALRLPDAVSGARAGAHQLRGVQGAGRMSALERARKAG